MKRFPLSRFGAITAMLLIAALPLTAADPDPAAPPPDPVPPGSGDGEEVPDDDPMLAVIRRPWTGDLDGMLERRYVRVLVPPSRTLYFEDLGRQYGIAYELFTRFEDELNKRHPHEHRHLRTRVTFVPLEGRGGIAAGALTITEERDALVDFSAPLFHGINEILVTGPGAPELGSLDDLAGQRVFVRPSSSYWTHLEALNERLAAVGKAPVALLAAPGELEDEDLREMANAGLVELLIIDDYKAELWAQVFPQIRPRPDLVLNAGGDLGWMFRDDSPKLKEAIDAFVKTHRQGTLIGNTLIKRYLGSTRFIEPATSEAELARYEEVVDLFRTYGERYELDHLLMMAQGYQESRLDHQARSAAGAVGIMQIMPATGETLGVGDIHQVGPNIEGGIKYIRQLIDQEFDDPAINELNRTLFAFAAYNAGPGRMRRLRRLTEEQGLDPNRWFGNVERLAARKVGAETVTYVANIFKYYVAYRLLEQARADRERARAAAERVL